ncbi:MAG: hypothetical protein Q9225_001831 [Loekoesia sp. 1 TL-2023]
MDLSLGPSRASADADIPENQHQNLYSDLSHVDQRWIHQELNTIEQARRELVLELDRRQQAYNWELPVYPDPQEAELYPYSTPFFANEDISNNPYQYHENSLPHADNGDYQSKDNSYQRTEDGDGAHPAAQNTFETEANASASVSVDASEKPRKKRGRPPKSLKTLRLPLDNMHFHRGTRTLREDGPAAPYGDLPDDDYYAPGISIHTYKTLCTSYCGRVIPSKLKGGEAPQLPRQKSESTETDVRCIICGAGYEGPNRRYHVEQHFPICVKRNGNPEGYHWFDSPAAGEQTNRCLETRSRCHYENGLITKPGGGHVAKNTRRSHSTYRFNIVLIMASSTKGRRVFETDWQEYLRIKEKVPVSRKKSPRYILARGHQNFPPFV